jgi:acetoin utilization deacetylase AcuC-like enzyme
VTLSPAIKPLPRRAFPPPPESLCLWDVMNRRKTAVFLRSARYEEVSRALPRNAERAATVQALIDATGVLDAAYDVQEVIPATASTMRLFHSRDFVAALQKSRAREEHGLVDDCAAFRGVFELASLEAGGSVAAANLLSSGEYRTAVWWGGGRHHAKTDGAAGYCYVNDVVIAILELLKTFERVMYIDIDVHHGDGVEEVRAAWRLCHASRCMLGHPVQSLTRASLCILMQAFCYSNTVLTCSFHHHAPLFFPGSGSLADQGGRGGKEALINVPLQEGCRYGSPAWGRCTRAHRVFLWKSP